MSEWLPPCHLDLCRARAAEDGSDPPEVSALGLRSTGPPPPPSLTAGTRPWEALHNGCGREGCWRSAFPRG